MELCIEHRLPLWAVCLDSRCHEDISLCLECRARGHHPGHEVLPLERLVADLKLFEEKRNRLETDLREEARQKSSEIMCWVRAESKARLDDIEQALVGNIESLQLKLRKESEEALKGILVGLIPLREDRCWLRVPHIAVLERAADQLRYNFSRTLQKISEELLSNLQRIVRKAENPDFSSRVIVGSIPLQEGRTSMTSTFTNQHRLHGKGSRSSSSKLSRPRSSAPFPERQRSTFVASHIESPQQRLTKKQFFKPQLLRGSQLIKHKSNSTLQYSGKHKQEKEADLMMKIHANREAISGCESSVLSLIEQKQRVRRQREEQQNEDRIRKLIDDRVEEALKKMPRSSQSSKGPQPKLSDRIAPEAFEEQKFEQPLPIESVLKCITNDVSHSTTTPPAKSQVDKRTPSRQVDSPGTQSLELRPGELGKGQGKTEQNPRQSSVSLPIPDKNSKTLCESAVRKPIKKTRQSTNKTIDEIDEQVELVPPQQPAASKQQMEPVLKKRELISGDEMMERLAIVPHLHLFLEQNLKEMEEAWLEADLMCWNRYFQLKLQCGMDNGDYLPIRKKCKKHAFDPSRLLSEVEANMSRIKISSIKKRKNLLVLQYMVMHIMALVVLIEGRLPPQESNYSKADNERVLSQLQQDQLAPVYSFTTEKLQQLKNRQSS